jgi:hypothetical protein
MTGGTKEKNGGTTLNHIKVEIIHTFKMKKQKKVFLELWDCLTKRHAASLAGPLLHHVPFPSLEHNNLVEAHISKSVSLIFKTP